MGGDSRGRSLSVLHISESDGDGGASTAAYRMHEALNRSGVSSRMLVGRKVTRDARTKRLKRNTAWRAADRVLGAPLDALGLQYVFYPSSFAVRTDAWFRQADVVQLHNTHGSYFSHSALPLLSRARPLVWFLHDMWAFTGHVIYSQDCERWLDGCGSCPYLHVYPELPRDSTRLLWRWKRRVYARSRLTIVTPSRWLASLAARSSLLAPFSVQVIPNGVDLGHFRPRDRREARARLGLEADRPILLFVGSDLGDERKGGDLLADTMRLLDRDAQLVIVGSGTAGGLDAHSLGHLDQCALPDAYSAADLLVLPSRSDNLPNTAVESAACGTPAVAFGVGGVPEVVRHLQTGWLAKPEDPASLAEGIRSLLDDDALRQRLGESARRVAEAEYSDALQAQRLVSLYRELVPDAPRLST